MTKISTNISGDISIGCSGKTFWVFKQPTTLIHHKPENCPLFFVGACTANSRNQPESVVIKPVTTTTQYAASAPLASAVKIELFSIPGTSTCRGILIHYSSGLCRALGECRLAVDQVDDYEMPIRLCFTSAAVASPRVICSAAESPHSHHAYGNLGWTCCKMEGLLMWSTDNTIATLIYKNN